MRPLVLTAAGVALGLAVLLPVARAQVTVTQRPAAVVVPAAAPARPALSPPVPAAHPTAQAVPPTAVTVTGPAVATRYGPVQVRVTMTGSRLADVEAVQLPDGDGESRQINREAAPRLRAAALAGQDAQVDTVSGASWTSGGYRRSLQAALDTARALPPAG